MSDADVPWAQRADPKTISWQADVGPDPATGGVTGAEAVASGGSTVGSHHRSSGWGGHDRRLTVVLMVLLVLVSGLAGGALAAALHRTSGGPTALQPLPGGAASNQLWPGSSGGGYGQFGRGRSGATGGTAPSGTSTPTDAASVGSTVAPGIVDINTWIGYQQAQAAGTGMVLTSAGQVLTNNHVISGATKISVTDVGNGATYSARVVGYDRSRDVAVLRLVGASGLRTVTSGAPGTARIGQSVVTVGNAGGTGGQPTATSGSITALNQSITASDTSDGTSEQLTGLIETDANVVPGDSGGPLVDQTGHVLGMDTAASEGFRFSSAGGQGYAIPIDDALSIVHQIEAGASSPTVHIGPTALLGVQVQATGANGSGYTFGWPGHDRDATSTSGALVAATVSGGPAEAAGLTAGDVITAVAGHPVTSADSLSDVMLTQTPHTTVTVDYLNPAGAQHSVLVQLTAGPPQ